MDVMMRRRELMGMQGVLKTVSGPFVTVNDALARNAKSLVVNFTPVQASGTPAPDNVLPISGWTGVAGYRAGVNLFDSATAIIGYKLGSDTGALEFNASFCTSDFIPMPSDTITVYLRNVCRGVEARCFFCYDANKTFIAGSSSGLSGGDNRMASGEKTIVAGTKYIRVVYANTATDVSVNYPATAITYTPYSGTTYPVTFPALGKNLFDKNNSALLYNRFINTDSRWSYSTTSTSFVIPVRPNTTYTLSGYPDNLSLYRCGLLNGELPTGNEDVNLSDVVRETSYASFGQSRTITTGSSTRYVVVQFTFSSYPDCLATVQLEAGSTATAYEPYTNTSYGGYVDLVSGVLVGTHKGVVYDGSLDEGWMLYGKGSASTFAMQISLSSYMKNTNATIDANYLKRIYSNDTWGNYDNWISTNSSNYLITGIQSITTVDAWKAYLAEHPLTVAYELYTPITYQLTPQTIAMLKGTNNVWSNTNGNVELTYYAQ